MNTDNRSLTRTRDGTAAGTSTSRQRTRTHRLSRMSQAAHFHDFGSGDTLGVPSS